MQISAPPSCSQVLVSFCSFSWETVSLSTKLISIFIRNTGLRLKIPWAPWKQIENKSKRKHHPLHPSCSRRSAVHQGRVTQMPLSCATLPYSFPELDLFIVWKSEPWRTWLPRLCSYLVEDSLKLWSTLFWEERRLNQYSWPDPVPKSPLVKRDESRQRREECHVPCDVFPGKKQTKAERAGVLDPSLRCKLMAEGGGYVKSCQC